MQLFFIGADANAASHGSAMNLDLFVNARDVDQAKRFWRRYYELEATDEPEQIFTVGNRRRAGAVGWNTPALRRVWRWQHSVAA